MHTAYSIQSVTSGRAGGRASATPATKVQETQRK